jgi:hypothetical protein
MPNNKTQRVGSRRKVFNGTAERTVGNLRKEDLLKNKAGRIVSVKRHHTMKRRIAGGEFGKTDEETTN